LVRPISGDAAGGTLEGGGPLSGCLKGDGGESLNEDLTRIT
jgi:hypothetical protein